MDEENVIEMMGERWKPVKGYENLYLISESGRIYSIRSKRCMKQSIKKYKSGTDYITVSLSKKGEHKHPLVHRLVAEHFISDPPFDGALCRHLDGNSLNNHYTNLAWGTYRDNTNDRLNNDNDTRVLINEQDIINIKNDLIVGMKMYEISKKYNISYGVISSIVNKNTWPTIGKDMSNFNYAEKQKEMAPDFKPIFEDYMTHTMSYVVEKYGIPVSTIERRLRENKIHKKKPLETREELQPLFDDFLKHNIAYVMEKYNLTRRQVQKRLQDHGIRKRRLDDDKLDLDQMIADYLEHDTKYVAEKYNMTKDQVHHLMHKYNVHKEKPEKIPEDQCQLIIADYLAHNMNYVVKKYSLGLGRITWILKTHNVRKRKR